MGRATHDNDTQTAAPPATAAEEIGARIRDLAPQLAEVDQAIATLTEKKNELVVPAYSAGDTAARADARAELNKLNNAILLEERRKAGIEAARSQLNEQLEEATQVERAAETKELLHRLAALDDEIEPARTDVSKAIGAFGAKASELRVLLMTQAHLQRELTIKQGIRPDAGEMWEVLERVLHGVAEELAAKANAAGVPIGRSEGDFRRGVQSAARTPSAPRPNEPRPSEPIEPRPRRIADTPVS
jgi:hypothetical protein